MNRSIHNISQESAMTEIALALAMGFFSIMVLTLLSMGVEGTPKDKTQGVILAPSTAPAERNTGVLETSKQDLIIIFDGQQFLGTDMKVIDPSEITLPDQRVILALDPSLTLKQAMEARAQIKSNNLVASNLDQKWIRALGNRRGGSND